MSAVHPVSRLLAELRGFASRRRRVSATEAIPRLAALLGQCHSLAVEPLAGGIAFRLEAGDAAGRARLTCIVHDTVASVLTPAEQRVADELCAGRTLAEIARLRGVSANTVKSQVRQIFRKLDVANRVALVRKLCP